MQRVRVQRDRGQGRAGQGRDGGAVEQSPLPASVHPGVGWAALPTCLHRRGGWMW